MSMPIEAEAVALFEALRRVEPDITAELVDSMSLLDRLLAASIAGVAAASDSHWVLVRNLASAAIPTLDELLSDEDRSTLKADLAEMARTRRSAAATAANWPMA